MESRSHLIAAGLFVIALTVGLIFTAVWLTSDRIDTVRYQVVSMIPVTGLHPKATVRLRGVDVGRVDTIDFDPNDPRAIRIGISVDRSAPLTRGTYGQLAYQGVTGLSYIALEDDGANRQPLAPDSDGALAIPLRASLFDQLAANSQELLRDAAVVTGRINELLSTDNIANAGAALRSARVATQQIAALAAELRPAARSLQGVETDTRATMDQLKLLLADLRGTTAEFGRHMGAIDEVGRSAGSVAATGRSVQAALLADTLPRLSGAIDELARTSRALDQVLEQVGQEPRGLLFGRAPAAPGPGEPGYAAPGGGR
jgi:phospholipid/cholesterol/gamma-HCH transport system substrate-binding protein